MRTFTLTLFALFFTVLLSAQITPFMKKFGTLEDENIWRVEPLQDGNFLAGANAFVEGKDRQVQLHRFNLAGEILSTWELGQSGFDSYSDATELEDGSLIAMFITRPYENNPGVDNTYICRILPNGTIDWELQFGNEDVEVRGIELIQDLTGNIVICGLMTDLDSSNDKGVIIKLTPVGSILFQKEWDVSSDYDRFDDLVEVGDGYLVSGYSDFINPDEPVVIPVVAKFDFNGNLIWSNAYDDGFEVRQNQFGIVADKDGFIYGAYGSRGEDSDEYEEQDVVVFKMDQDGSVVWANRFGNSAGGDDVDNLHFSHEGDLLVIGDLEGLGFDGNDGYVMRVDTDGNLKQVNLIGKNGREETADLEPIVENGCEGYLIVGNTNSFSIDDNRDNWIIKTDHNLGAFEDCYTADIPFTETSVTMAVNSIGSIDNWNVTSTPNISITTGMTFTATNIQDCPPTPSTDCVVASTHTLYQDIALEYYPNPTTHGLTLEGDIHQVRYYQIVDMLGRPLGLHPLQGSWIDLQDLQSGFYAIQLLDEEKRGVATLKIIKQ